MYAMGAEDSSGKSVASETRGSWMDTMRQAESKGEPKKLQVRLGGVGSGDADEEFAPNDGHTFSGAREKLQGAWDQGPDEDRTRPGRPAAGAGEEAMVRDLFGMDDDGTARKMKASAKFAPSPQTACRLHFHLSHVLQWILQGKQNEATAYIIRLLRRLRQTCLDGGAWTSSHLLLPVADPLFDRECAPPAGDLQRIAAYQTQMSQLRRSRTTAWKAQEHVYQTVPADEEEPPGKRPGEGKQLGNKK